MSGKKKESGEYYGTIISKFILLAESRKMSFYKENIHLLS
ncbi:hypothetical protein DFO73_10450 [Cytobacillus oceanisediminis]|uniref:Uncharacterized protein n=1 Tax=Cytobacillus oceanisediminis TaxID=665099 RepID=A0A2V2ZY54_9BACI|nr:hypothetical protein DFO73_10450 [Cytobacillus oceanisediminis]